MVVTDGGGQPQFGPPSRPRRNLTRPTSASP